MIHRSRYPDPVIPDASLPDHVLAGAAARGDRPALVDGVTGETVTYRDLARVVPDGAAALAGEGVGPGQVVALVGPNRPAWAVAFLAVLAAGSAVTPVNPALTAAEIGGQLQSSGAGVVVADAAVAAKVHEAVGASGCRVLDLDALVTASRAPGVVAAVDPAALAVLPFSSGTTGLPKGVMLTHRNVVACLCQHEHLYPVGADDVFLAALPFFHIYGLSMVLGYGLRHGAAIVTLPRYDPARYRALIAERRVTWLHLVPPVALLLGADESDTDFSSVRHAVSGAAPIDDRALARAEARVGCRIGQGYGMTEASPGVTWVPDDGSCPAGSVGYLVGGTEARVVDPATGADTDGAGELWVRGPQVMAGYLDDPGATAATIVEDGWLRTGDILRVDEGGAWWVVDRLKELIKYKGYQVAPAELEAVLLEHPAIADAAVVGVADRAAGEIPKAFVTADGAPPSPAEVMAWCETRVAPYKKIRAVEFVDEIPRSPSGKILRRVLAARSP